MCLCSEVNATVVVVWVHGATRRPRAAGELSVSQCTRYIRASVHRVLLAADRLPEYDDRL